MRALVFIVSAVAGAFLAGARRAGCRSCGRSKRRCECRSNPFKHLLN